MEASGTGIKEIDKRLCELWTYQHTSPQYLVMNRVTLENITAKLQVLAAYSPVFSNTAPRKGGPVYINKYASALGKTGLTEIKVIISEDLPDEMILFASEVE